MLSVAFWSCVVVHLCGLRLSAALPAPRWAHLFSITANPAQWLEVVVRLERFSFKPCKMLISLFSLSAPVIVKQHPCSYVLYTFARPHVCLNTKSFIFPFAFHFNWPSFHICRRATPLVPVLPPSHHPAPLSR